MQLSFKIKVFVNFYLFGLENAHGDGASWKLKHTNIEDVNENLKHNQGINGKYIKFGAKKKAQSEIWGSSQ